MLARSSFGSFQASAYQLGIVLPLLNSFLGSGFTTFVGFNASWYADAWKLPKDERAKLRSKTFPGIAQAMVSQWTNFITEQSSRHDR